VGVDGAVSISLLLPDRRRAKLSVATAFYEVEKRLQPMGGGGLDNRSGTTDDRVDNLFQG